MGRVSNKLNQKTLKEKYAKVGRNQNNGRMLNKQESHKIVKEKPETLIKLQDKYVSKNLLRERKTKQTEIGQIPQDWKVCFIDDIFDLKQGKSLSSKKQTGFYLKPFLRTSNVFWGYLDLTQVDEMDIPEKDRKLLCLKKDDLLVCEGGDIGRTAIWNEELQECYYQNHIHRLRIKNTNVFPLFYMYWMDAGIRVLNVYGTFGNRTTIPNLSGKRLLKFKIPIPSLEEQKKIAGVLSQIQKAIEVQDKLIKSTTELKKTTMKHLFTYGTKREKTKQTEIGQIPQDWKVCFIDDIFDLKQGKSLSSKKQTGFYLKPFLRTSNVFWGYLDLTQVDEMDIPEKDRKLLCLKKDDLLVCEGGDIGRTAIWNEELQECYYQNHIHRLRIKNTNVFPLFYMYWMDAGIRVLNVYGTFGNRTTIPNLSGKRLLKFKIPIPSLEEQKKIAGILGKIDQKIEIHQNKKTVLNELFKSMLQKLMTGQIQIHNLNIQSTLKLNATMREG